MQINPAQQVTGDDLCVKFMTVPFLNQMQVIYVNWMHCTAHESLPNLCTLRLSMTLFNSFN